MAQDLKMIVCSEPTGATMQEWCSSVFLPFWANASHDRQHGGFIDRVDRAGRDIGVGFKRTRVQGRQIFVFSHAAMTGLLPDGLELAQSGVRFLRDHALDPAGRGWRFKVSPDGRTVVDGTYEFYCQSFVLFGLGWYLRASGDRSVLPLIDMTLDFLDSHLGESTHGGYVDSWASGAAPGAWLSP